MPSRIRLANDLTIITDEVLNFTENCYRKLPSNRGPLDLIFTIQNSGGLDRTPKEALVNEGLTRPQRRNLMADEF